MFVLVVLALAALAIPASQAAEFNFLTLGDWGGQVRVRECVSVYVCVCVFVCE